jgi:hypothetical protein
VRRLKLMWVWLILQILCSAEDYPFKKNPDELNVRGTYVQHMWVNGRVLITGTDAKTFLGYGSGRDLKVDLLEAMDAKGWTYELEGGLLKVTKSSSIGSSGKTSTDPLIGRVVGLGYEDSFSIRWDPTAQEFLVAVYKSDTELISMFPASRPRLEEIVDAYKAAEKAARTTRSESDVAVFVGESPGGSAVIRIAASYVQKAGVGVVFITIKNSDSGATSFAVPITSEHPDFARIPMEVGDLLQAARLYQP